MAIDSKNLDTWGERYADLLRSIGDDVDSCFREMARCAKARPCAAASALAGPVGLQLGHKGKGRYADWKMPDYKSVFEPFYELSKNVVKVPFGLRGVPDLRPFGPFSGTGSLPWWDAYNHVKHEYYDKMDEGNLGNVLGALAGLLVLNCIHKCSQFYLSMTGAIKGGIKHGALEQPVAPQFLTEELQKSPLGILATSVSIP